MQWPQSRRNTSAVNHQFLAPKKGKGKGSGQAKGVAEGSHQQAPRNNGTVFSFSSKTTRSNGFRDKFCLTSAGTHRHACWCTCVPFLQRLRAYRGLHPPRSAAEGWGPPTPPQLTLPTRTSPRPVGPPLPHARTPRLKLQRRPSSNLPTAASEDTSPRATEAPLSATLLHSSATLGQWAPHSRTRGEATDPSPPNSRARTPSNRGAPPAQQPSAVGPQQPHARTTEATEAPLHQHYMTTQGHTATSSLPTRVQQAAPHQL